MKIQPHALVDVADGLLTITLDRPDRMNAFTPQMLREMIAAFDEADADDAIRAVIVVGSGQRAFCAGADLAAGAAAFDYSDMPVWSEAGSPVRPDGSIDWDHQGVRDGGGLLSLRIYQSRKPVIGAINGAAVGVGATMTLPMDFLIASDAARFGFVFARRGIVPEAASSWFLPRRVGIDTALDWCYTGRMVGAAEAQAAGMVRQVVPADGLIDAARALARDLTEGSAPVSVALTRAMMWRMLGTADPMAAHRMDSQLMWQRGRSSDAAEGILAFLEKRPAQFSDVVGEAMAELPAALNELRW